MVTETYVLSGGKPVIPKDPNATLDYTIDWQAEGWMPPADQILSLVVIVQAPLVLTSSEFVSTPLTTPPVHKTVAWVSGALAALGQKLSITHRITTAQGRIDDRTVYVKIQER